jgi:hypothetical protein
MVNLLLSGWLVVRVARQGNSLAEAGDGQYNDFSGIFCRNN